MLLMGCDGGTGIVTPPPSTTTLNPSTTPAPGTTSGITVNGGNLHAIGPSSSYGHAASIGTVPVGSLTYFEYKPTVLPSASKISCGVCNASKALGPGGQSWVGGTDNNSVGIYDDGIVWLNDHSNSTAETAHFAISAGTWIGVEIDEAAHTLQFRNGSNLSAVYACPTGTLYAFIGLDDAAAEATVNFGATNFAYTQTTGYTGRLS